MSTQLSCNSDAAGFRRIAQSGCGPSLLGSGEDAGGLSTIFAAMLRRSGLAAAALLTALGPLAAAQAISLSDLALAGPAAAASLLGSGFEVAGRGGQLADPHSHALELANGGLTVTTGPLAAADGASGGMVLSWTVASRDPAYLVTVTSLFSKGVASGSRVAGDEIPGTPPDFGVVPGGNLSVFDTGAVDLISWDFLEFSCAMLALRFEDYIRLSSALGTGLFDENARVPRFRAVPEPATSLLTSQGILLLALLRSRRKRGRSLRSCETEGSLRFARTQGTSPLSHRCVECAGG